VLFVVDGSAALSAEGIDECERMDRGKVLCVLNKMDLGLAQSIEDAREKLRVDNVVAVSALRGDGLDALREWIFSKTVKGEAGEIARERIAVNARQADALREAEGALGRLDSLLAEEASAELLSLEIRSAAESLGKITGRSVAGDLLEVIFSRFCIGK
jgi:tRNA modification GTPase